MPTPVSPAAGGSAPRSTPLAQAAKAWAEGFNFSSRTAVKRYQVPREQAASSGPAAVRRAYAFYDSWQQSTRLIKFQTGSSTVFGLHTLTDGDDGYLELFSSTGALLASGATGLTADNRRTIRWDATLGAVRQRVSPDDISASVKAFRADIDAASAPNSLSGKTVSAAEMQNAADALVGSEPAYASVDGFEHTALLRVMADNEVRLNGGARQYGQALSAVYAQGSAAPMTNIAARAVSVAGAWGSSLKAADGLAADPSLINVAALSSLTRQAFGFNPTQLVPVSAVEARQRLIASGATSTQARAALKVLGPKPRFVAGQLFDDTAQPAVLRGPVLFALSDGQPKVSALWVPQMPVDKSPVPRAEINKLLGVDRPVEVVSERKKGTATQYELKWRPPDGRVVEAMLTVPNNPKAARTISGTKIPPALEPNMTQLIADDLEQALRAKQRVVGWVSNGQTSYVVHEPAAGGPARTSKIQIGLDPKTMERVAKVSAKPIGTSVADKQLSVELALAVARFKAAEWVADPNIGDDGRLEVALRTRWADASDVSFVQGTETSREFVPATDRYELLVSRIWGDNGLFVTFAKNGGVRTNFS